MTVNLYVPGGSSEMRYTPASVVATVVSTPVAMFIALTVAPEIIAPCGSVTVPFNVPRSPWPDKLLANRTKPKASLLILSKPPILIEQLKAN